LLDRFDGFLRSLVDGKFNRPPESNRASCFVVSHAAALQLVHSLLGVTVPQTVGLDGITKLALAYRGKTLVPGLSGNPLDFSLWTLYFRISG
jgi:hypothetical protein